MNKARWDDAGQRWRPGQARARAGTSSRGKDAEKDWDEKVAKYLRTFFGLFWRALD